MNEKNFIKINELPTKTWNRLAVNFATAAWDKSLETEKCNNVFDFKKSGDQAKAIINICDKYSVEKVNVSVAESVSAVLYEIIETFTDSSVKTEVTLGENSYLKIVQIYKPQNGTALIDSVKAECPAGSTFENIKLVIGKGNTYSDTRVALQGDKSKFKSDIAYFAAKDQKIDFNVAADHFGKDTESGINAAGALKDNANKIFRGTIDFKNGSSGSVGNEHETVLMLGDGAVNKTVPLILCAEENVVGNHGATIGELDDDTLFYFESRGIDKETAENILARASLESAARNIDDKEISNDVLAEIDSLL